MRSFKLHGFGGLAEWGLLILFSGGLGVCSLGAYRQIFDPLEEYYVGWVYQFFLKERSATDAIVVIDIDEQSVKDLEPIYGPYPWPRRAFRDLLNVLQLGSPLGIVFDIPFFSASYNLRPLKTDDPAQDAEGSKTVLDLSYDDGELIKALSLTSNVSLGAFCIKNDNQSPGSEPPRDEPSVTPDKFSISLKIDPSFAKEFHEAHQLHHLQWPTELLYQHVDGVHVVNSEQGFSLSKASLPILIESEKYYPSTTMQTVGMLHPGVLKHVENGLLLDGPQKLRILISDSFLFLPKLYHPHLGVRTVSFSNVIASGLDLLRQTVRSTDQLVFDPLTLKSKVVLVGESISKKFRTPFGPGLSWTQLHATAISNILNQDFLTPVSFKKEFLLAAVTYLASFLVFLAVGISGPSLFFSWVPFAFFKWYALAAFYWNSQLLHVMGFFVTFFGIWLIIALFWMLSVRPQRLKFKAQLQHHFPTLKLEQALKQKIDLTVRPPAEAMGVLMQVRIRKLEESFQQASLGSAVEALNLILQQTRSVIDDAGGYMDYVLSDRCLSYWGFFENKETDLVRALFAGLNLSRNLKNIKSHMHMPQNFEVNVLSLIHVGKIIGASLGGSYYRRFTIFGKAQQQLDLLVDSLSSMPVHLVVTDLAVEQMEKSNKTSQEFIFRKIGEAPVGSQGMALYEPLCEKDAEGREVFLELKEQFEFALKDFEAQQWAVAEKKFAKLAHSHNDELSFWYSARCNQKLAAAN
jgi:CHASE2 domain-containing sensor protein